MGAEGLEEAYRDNGRKALPNCTMLSEEEGIPKIEVRRKEDQWKGIHFTASTCKCSEGQLLDVAYIMYMCGKITEAFRGISCSATGGPVTSPQISKGVGARGFEHVTGAQRASVWRQSFISPSRCKDQQMLRIMNAPSSVGPRR